MVGAKLAMLLSAVLFVFVSASTTGNAPTEMSQLLCDFKILVVGILPTIALILFLLSPFAIGLGIVALIAAYLLHRKNNPEEKVDFMKFGSLPTVLKVGVAALALGLLTPIMGVLCIALAVVLPILVGMVAGTATPAC
ncbi:MAG: hypothetical protein Sv326_1252 [Candidatus Fermentimicrarchaeum limneticum]|uniref:Uncharacterized protein n=1 Tax=Fermentimicrarchaeum limneticum TaxID=2795018 RepID=A0A7D5XQD2_FERL1|nr:MAG: hypothetical protein Sv326_1252 [Candidatus Fermentimicrarchaeum limneticum]